MSFSTAFPLKSQVCNETAVKEQQNASTTRVTHKLTSTSLFTDKAKALNTTLLFELQLFHGKYVRSAVTHKVTVGGSKSTSYKAWLVPTTAVQVAFINRFYHNTTELALPTF
jgi:hypothetical protein